MEQLYAEYEQYKEWVLTNYGIRPSFSNFGFLTGNMWGDILFGQGILQFGYKTGRVSSTALWLLIAFMLELFLLIPASLVTYSDALYIAIAVLMAVTILTYGYMLWRRSRFVFLSQAGLISIPVVILIVVLIGQMGNFA